MTVRHLSLTTTAAPSAVQRVITTCARRRCVITAMRFELRGGRGHLELEVTGGAAQMRRLPHWLAALVDVLDVGEHGRGPGAPATPGAPTPRVSIAARVP